MNVHEKLSAPLRGAEHYNQIDPSPNVRKSLDTTITQYEVQFVKVEFLRRMLESDGEKTTREITGRLAVYRFSASDSCWALRVSG
jgi:hypothetical protein